MKHGTRASLRLLTAGVALAAVACGPPDVPKTVLREASDARISEVTRDRDWVESSLKFAYAASEGVTPSSEGMTLWLSGNGLSRDGRRLFELLETSDAEGLDPEAYGIAAIDAALADLDETDDPETRTALLADVDVALSVALLEYSRDVVRGRFDPAKARQDWRIEPEPFPENPLVRVSEGESLEDLRESLRPRLPYYDRLTAALADLRDVADSGGWPEVGAAPSPEAGDRGAGIATLRARLAASTDSVERRLARSGTEPDLYDESLAGAVKRFQSRHSLEADGVIGEATLRELNTPVETRIESVVLNLDRLRWIPRDLGENVILVNVAGFEFEMLENHEPTLRMNVVVGREEWATKLFTARMDHLVLNPYWNVPESILADEILPQVREDPTFLASNEYEVLGPDGTVLADASDIDWDDADGGDAGDSAEPRFRIRQAPGTRNALGRVKFMFPNPYSIYLHDTPDDHLFSRSYRAFSHGCIRVEQPLELAHAIVDRYTDRSAEEVDRLLESGESTTIQLDRPLDVYIVYFTAWVAEDGTLSFYRDIYDRDDVLHRMLEIPTEAT